MSGSEEAGGTEVAAGSAAAAGEATTTSAALAGLWEQFRGPFSEQVSVLEDAATAVLSDALDPDLHE
ncbi:MAG: hypothetical protein ABR591_16495, partial [Candidatus Velthaea sp.]